jgi:hypothetical protein
MAGVMAGVAVARLGVRGRAHRDGGAIRIPVTEAVAVDPTDANTWQRTTRSWSPTERLRAAILVQALADLRAPPDSTVGAEVRTWFASPDRSGPCTFETVCDVLGLHADAVRAQVLGNRHAIVTAQVHHVPSGPDVRLPTPRHPLPSSAQTGPGHARMGTSSPRTVDGQCPKSTSDVPGITAVRCR